MVSTPHIYADPDYAGEVLVAEGGPPQGAASTAARRPGSEETMRLLNSTDYAGGGGFFPGVAPDLAAVFDKIGINSHGPLAVLMSFIIKIPEDKGELVAGDGQALENAGGPSADPAAENAPAAPEQEQDYAQTTTTPGMNIPAV